MPGPPNTPNIPWMRLQNQGVCRVDDTVASSMVAGQVLAGQNVNAVVPKQPPQSTKSDKVEKNVRRGINASENLRLVKYTYEYATALALLREHQDMSFKLRKMKAALEKLERIAKTQGGQAGANAAKSLVEARAAYEAARAAYEEQKAAVRAANQFLRQYESIKKGAGAAKGYAMTKLAGHAANFAKVLESTAVGRALMRTGKFIANPAFQKAVIGFGAAVAGIVSYLDSPAATTEGKVANGVLGAAAGTLPLLNPVTIAADLFAPKGYKPSEHFKGTAASLTVIGEALITGDAAGLDNFHQRSMRGEYGKLMQASSEAGEYWNEKGVAGGLQEFASEFWSWIKE